MFGATLVQPGYMCRTTIIFGTMKDDSLSINTLALNNNIVHVTGTPSKMASTLSQKCLTIFCKKAQNFIYFVPYNLVQISPACGPHT